MTGSRRGGVTERLASGALLIAAAAVLFGLAWRFHDSSVLGGLDQLFSVIGGGAGVVALYVAIRPRQAAGVVPDDGSSATLDALAAAVAAVWRPEQRHRRLINPHPLPTAWVTVGPPIGDHWSNVRSDGDPTPLNLDGCLDLKRTDALHKVLTDERLRGRVVILGAPGAGKTALLLRETLRLLQAREPGDRVPVLLRLSTWNPDEQNLAEWITNQIADEYAYSTPISTDRLLPLLDGLDEIPAPSRERALQAISNTFDPDHPLVLTSRSDEYLDSLAALPGTALAGAAVLQLTDVPADIVIGFLQRATGRVDWAQVFDRDITHHGGRLAVALTEPLWIDLARIAFTDPNQPDNQPADLLDLPDTDTIHTYLLDRLIVSAYPDPPEPSPTGHTWRRADAERYLRNLARHMQRLNTEDFAWWELALTVSFNARLAHALLAGLMGGSMVGLTVGLTVGLLAGEFMFGVVAGLVAGFMGWLALAIVFSRIAWRLAPTRGQIRWRRSVQPLIRRLNSRLAVGLMSWLAVGLIFLLGVGLAAERRDPFFVLLYALWLALWFAFWLAVQLTAEFTTFFDNSDADILAANPLGLLRNDRRRTMVTASAFGLAVGLAVGLTVGLAFGIGDGLRIGLAYGLTFGIANGITGGIAFALTASSWGWLQYARLWWCSRDDLPWPLMTFLADAHRRGLLRQTGGTFQFRHALLRDRLAR
ncbi:NACHT domain-containing protein [Actinoplanes auranticolor]|uniref:NACHT domain-containing protein n=1 Tax=Actinoplanes auranticolor TaxID=47988 RepID=UPI001BB33921|nr:NACHT domain-containing protein [Actinoplanes auranticolor]